MIDARPPDRRHSAIPQFLQRRIRILQPEPRHLLQLLRQCGKPHTPIDQLDRFQLPACRARCLREIGNFTVYLPLYLAALISQNTDFLKPQSRSYRIHHGQRIGYLLCILQIYRVRPSPLPQARLTVELLKKSRHPSAEFLRRYGNLKMIRFLGIVHRPPHQKHTAHKASAAARLLRQAQRPIRQVFPRRERCSFRPRKTHLLRAASNAVIARHSDRIGPCAAAFDSCLPCNNVHIKGLFQKSKALFRNIFLFGRKNKCSPAVPAVFHNSAAEKHPRELRNTAVPCSRRLLRQLLFQVFRK